ncbi:hypothetical protein K435DRAFT_100937 [Dendrothele bispora CBS 962.96]|uniref:Uncharacterized protein n=1 Tax=Dendrothele bispora (strain CBS 962.96) TaxID=1314807 RepID=A0A4S8KNJ3_DENBC|nr:hypothetical protein K435DRAFT_100937 [Dendrothele bispora CBS 962.96]
MFTFMTHVKHYYLFVSSGCKGQELLTLSSTIRISTNSYTSDMIHDTNSPEHKPRGSIRPTVYYLITGAIHRS